MHTARLLLQPIVRASLASIKSSPYLHLFHTNLRRNRALRTWLNELEFKVHRNLPNPYWNLVVRKYSNFPGEIFRNSGGNFAVSTIVGLSVIIGSTRVWPHIAYCTDGFEFLADDPDFRMSDYSDSDEDHRALVAILRKFLMPAFFLATLLLNWGQPIVIAAKLILILYATKPSPFSVYLVIEQLRHQAIRQHPIIYRYIQSCYAKKVEVEDYMLLCFARVELNGQNLTLLGILGSWWVLPLASWLEALSIFRNNFLVR